MLVDTTNGERTWTTIGVSENIIEASWQALFDSLVYGLLLATVPSSTPLMPTDPFVPSNLDDVPRQEPNLAPGVHMPPAKSWRADRPGDLEAGQPTGAPPRTPGTERRVRALARGPAARPLHARAARVGRRRRWRSSARSR